MNCCTRNARSRRSVNSDFVGLSGVAPLSFIGLCRGVIGSSANEYESTAEYDYSGYSGEQSAGYGMRYGSIYGASSGDGWYITRESNTSQQVQTATAASNSAYGSLSAAWPHRASLAYQSI